MFSRYTSHAASPSSQTPEEPHYPRLCGFCGSVCYLMNSIDPFVSIIISWLYHFSALFSARRSPCLTLKPCVTASAPRTRYRLLAGLYRTGFPRYVSETYKCYSYYRNKWNAHSFFPRCIRSSRSYLFYHRLLFYAMFLYNFYNEKPNKTRTDKHRVVRLM